jgi:hypothetical protein
MIAKAVKKILRPLRELAGKFVIPDKGSHIGPHGCIYTAASFVTWNQVEGDYLEFGVYQGESFSAAFDALQRYRREHASAQSAAVMSSAEYRAWQQTPPRFFAFDSFEGLPAAQEEKPVDYHPGAYGCSEAEFKANIAKQGVDLSRVTTVPGFYDRSLTPEAKRKYGIRKAAVVMIDCDLYESTVPVLDFLTDIVGQGTVLIFHDWFRFKGRPDCGEQRACREWLARNPHLELIDHWRQGPQAVSFIVNLK